MVHTCNPSYSGEWMLKTSLGKKLVIFISTKKMSQSVHFYNPSYIEGRGRNIKVGLGKKHETLSEKYFKAKSPGCVPQLAECLPNKHVPWVQTSLPQTYTHTHTHTHTHIHTHTQKHTQRGRRNRKGKEYKLWSLFFLLNLGFLYQLP
jgi:kynurenine formamidase